MTDHQMFLGQILQDNNVFYKAQPREWWFPDAKDKVVFRAIEGALNSSMEADIVTIGSRPGMDAAYVASLTSSIPSSANWKYYAGRCKSQGAKVELRTLGMMLAEAADDRKASELMEDINQVTERILSGSSEYQIQSVKDLLPQVMNDIEERYQQRGRLAGIPTGYKQLDNALGGLQKQMLYYIGARPSQGKSAFGLNMASNVAVGRKVGFLSLESSWREMVNRMIAESSGINSRKIKSGYLNQSDMGKIIDALGILDNKNLFIYDKPNCSKAEVEAQCRRMVNKYKVDVIFIDYLQLIQTGHQTDRERVAHASKALKNLARELDIPIVSLMQLGRDSDERRPRLGDAQHSSQIEQDADVGILIYWQAFSREGQYLKKPKVDDPETEVQKIHWLIDKQRDGDTCAIPVEFDGPTVSFREVEKK